MKAHLEDIEHAIYQIIAAHELAGLTIGIVQGNEIVYAQAFGVKSLDTREAMTPDSLFHLASISKTFVCTSVMQLVERGQVRLDAPVVSYLPYFEIDDPRYTQITVQQMLSHISGMPDVEDYHWEQPEYDDGALERYVRSLKGEKLIHAPGKKFAYSNMAYEVLGDLIAKVSGQTFENYVAENILQPLEMTHSTFLKSKVAPELATTPHLNMPQTEVSPIYPYHRAHAPSSTLHSNVLEMGNWLIAHLHRGRFKERRILTEASYELLWRPYAQVDASDPDEHIGLSWFLRRHKGHLLIGHDGGDVGYNSGSVLLPEKSMGVVVLANTISSRTGAIQKAILDVILGYEPVLPKPQAIVPLSRTLKQDGLRAAVEEYQRLKERHADEYNFNEKQFPNTAWPLTVAHRIAEAVQLMQLGVTLYPESAEMHCGLGQAYHDNGEDDLALQSVRKCLELEPENEWAQELMKKYEILQQAQQESQKS